MARARKFSYKSQALKTGGPDQAVHPGAEQSAAEIALIFEPDLGIDELVAMAGGPGQEPLAQGSGFLQAFHPSAVGREPLFECSPGRVGRAGPSSTVERPGHRHRTAGRENPGRGARTERGRFAPGSSGTCQGADQFGPPFGPPRLGIEGQDLLLHPR